MTLAVGQLSDPTSGTHLGTVFACASTFAITALHCVGDRHTGSILIPRVQCSWGTQKVYAVVVEADRENDVVLLRLERPLAVDLTPIELVAAADDHSSFTAPGAPASISGVFGYAVSGEVTWSQGVLYDGASVIQLSCRESAAGLSMHGLSGAPVLVGQPPKAVGIIRWNPPRADNAELAAGASLFAAPSKAVLSRWPQLSQVRPTSPERAALVRRLAKRRRSRTQAELEADVEKLLLMDDLGVAECDLDASESGLLEVRTALVALALRNDLRIEGVLPEAEEQMRRLIIKRKRRSKWYVGVLTDGAEWHLYHLAGDNFRRVPNASYFVDSNTVDTEGLFAWLEAILATAENIKPTPDEISRKLGSTSPSYLLGKLELAAIYEDHFDLPNVRVRRDMWAKLLTTASGANFTDDDGLFIDHTLLSLMAEVIGHAVLNFHPERPTLSASDIVSGAEFSKALIGGVIEPDFFDWIAHVPQGDRFVKDLARRLTRFSWELVEHDILKVLYESIIPPRVRHRLGEYYTPDWLAEEVIFETVTDPLNQRVLDASCGSGTFLFHAVRRYMSAARQVGRTAASAIEGAVEHVRGFDVHPVAVTLARVTYLLAIGKGTLQGEDRPAFAVPIYLCDSLRWGQQESLWSYGGLSVRTKPGHADLLYDPEFTDDEAFTERLKFPDRVLQRADIFDRLVGSLAQRAVLPDGRFRTTQLGALLREFDIDPDDWPILQQTFANMRTLHKEGRDHIWRVIKNPIRRSRGRQLHERNQETCGVVAGNQ